MTTAELIYGAVANLIFLTLLSWHIVLFLCAIWETGARFSRLVERYPASGEFQALGRGALLLLMPRGQSFISHIHFDDAGMHVAHQDQRIQVPWEHLRLFGAAPLLTVIEVVPENTRFALVWPPPYRVMKKLRRLTRENSPPQERTVLEKFVYFLRIR